MASVKRILVTGGAGFLGSHLCERLVAAGHDVVCVDNFFTSQKANVTHLLGCGNFELIRHDIVQPLWLGVDEIYNLACPAAPGHYQFNPIKTLKTSVIGAINVLGMARRCRAKVLQASTSEVYGDPEVHPQPETYRGAVNPIGPRACYDEGKRAAETLFMDYHRANGVNIRIVRIFNTYGPRMHPYDGRVVSTFIRQALAGEPLTIFGSGSQTRSFCYRDDLVDGMIRMMDAADDFTGPVNLGNPDVRAHRRRPDVCGAAAADRRSGAPPARHHPRPGAARLGAAGAAARGARADDRLVSHDRHRQLPGPDAQLALRGRAAEPADDRHDDRDAGQPDADADGVGHPVERLGRPRREERLRDLVEGGEDQQADGDQGHAAERPAAGRRDRGPDERGEQAVGEEVEQFVGRGGARQKPFRLRIVRGEDQHEDVGGGGRRQQPGNEQAGRGHGECGSHGGPNGGLGTCAARPTDGEPPLPRRW